MNAPIQRPTHAPLREEGPARSLAASLHHDAVVVDAHSDMLWRVCQDGRDLTQRLDVGHADLPRLREGGVDLQVFAVFVEPGQGRPTDHAEADRALDLFDELERRAGGSIRRVLWRRDLPARASGGRLHAVLGMEGAHLIGPSVERLRLLHARGVRLITLTWNPVNEWADGCQTLPDEPSHGGLSPIGFERIGEMDRLGIVVDLSHASPRTFDDALRTTRHPPVASHSCARALRNHPRNLTDDQVRALASRGGVMGINFYPRFLTEDETGAVGVESVLAHIGHVIRVAGEDHVGLGSDFDGIPSTPRGLSDVTALPSLTERLLREGFEEPVVRKILGENFLRVFREVLKDGPE